MIDREKVISALEICSNNSFCNNCWYWNNPHEGDCNDALMRDALELLKAHEPRVMTLEELEDWDGAVFFEIYETDMYYALIEDIELTACINGGYTFVNVEPGEYHRRVWDGEHYGKIWRCWTSRPTDEQREAVKWE